MMNVNVLPTVVIQSKMQDCDIKADEINNCLEFASVCSTEERRKDPNAGSEVT